MVGRAERPGNRSGVIYLASQGHSFSSETHNDVAMEPSDTRNDELDVRLAELHAASFGWACSCCGWNEADAEDVLQTTYVKVISGRARYDGRSAFRTWLFGVIRLTALEYARRGRSQERRAEALALEMAVTGAAGVPVDDGIERAERSAALRSALTRLPDRQREVLNLVLYQEMTIREAADVMEVSIGSARVHYDRGKKKLRVLLTDGHGAGGI
jgi:RNA polymerase sigma-70 factor, ECF subfamily